MLKINDVVKKYDPASSARLRRRGVDAGKHRPALGGVSLRVEEGQFHTLLGPSGCGKTTLLRSVAGLEHPDSGEIELGGDTLFSAERSVDLSPDRRRLGMVFQSYAIWPHMSVRQNVAFPMRVGRAKRPKAEVDKLVVAALESVGLSEAIDRSATKLSGGQQQRLAFARAMVGRPCLLLLDEPLSNLDAQLRASMRLELKRLQSELGLTTLYVTHDQAEALAISDVITIMSGGRIMQQGTPREIYDHPQNLFVARFIGSPNLLPAKIDDGSGRRTVLTDVGQLVLDEAVPAGLTDVVLVLRPEDLEPRRRADGAPGSAGANELSGTVVAQSFEGECIRHIVAVGDERIECRSARHSDVRPGDEVSVPVPGRALSVVDAQDEPH
ncbi:ABC transporter ATP-binding protein [Amycolatopsis sp. CA-161197]|uniref:ABC transporter ATP-binding protein n=1 Tax=Amycolatopsis sp. CA-161197 TaxID=3239922 RepID=UPI003D8AA825